jgi:hypothetical protein
MPKTTRTPATAPERTPDGKVGYVRADVAHGIEIWVTTLPGPVAPIHAARLYDTRFDREWVDELADDSVPRVLERARKFAKSYVDDDPRRA